MPIQQQLRDMAREWRGSSDRPTVSRVVSEQWDKLTTEWVTNPNAPLLIRRTGQRGVAQIHSSGRMFVHVDNSPAHWALGAALCGMTPTLSEVLEALEDGELPVSFAFSAQEAKSDRRYTGLLQASQTGRLVNQAGWKVCHIEPVGLGQGKRKEEVPLNELQEVTRRLMSPSNMFLVPKTHGGLGELEEFLAVFRETGTPDES